MSTISKITASAIFSTVLAGCGGSDSDVSSVDLSFSDAAVNGASEVVITVDRITFERKGSDDIIVERFNGESMAAEINGELDAANADITEEGSDTFTIDLLTVQGNDSRLVVEDVQLPAGEYSNMIIDVVDEDVNASFVTDAEGKKLLKVPSDSLKLGKFTINPTSSQSMVVEFGLQQSMTYNPGPDRYNLKPRGVRIVSVDEASLVDGNIIHSALQANGQCEALDLGGTAGSVYLYEGHSLDTAYLADNFDPELVNNAGDSIAPIASASLQSENFALSYLEPGDYTVAVACHSEFDGADTLERISIPNPGTQVTEITLKKGDWLSCSVPFTDDACLDNGRSAQ